MKSCCRIVGLLVLVVVAGGCATRRAWNELDRWREDLKLSAKVPESIESDKPSLVAFELLNSGRREINACLGVSRGFYAFWEQPTSEGRRSTGTVRSIDHSYCEMPFTLAPGARFRWTEPVNFGRLPPGTPVTLLMDVEVVQPRGCHRKYGCYSQMVFVHGRADVR